MAEFERVDPEGLSDRDLMVAILTGQHKLHDCVEGFRREQGAINRAAQEKRRLLASSVAAMRGDVRGLHEEVGWLRGQQEIDGGRITRLSQLFGAEKVDKGEKRPKGKGVATWGSLRVWATVGTMIAGFAALYKILIVLAPGAWAMVLALHHYLMNGAS